jgi:hypothetical protein
MTPQGLGDATEHAVLLRIDPAHDPVLTVKRQPTLTAVDRARDRER